MDDELFAVKDFVGDYTEKQLHRIDELHSSRMPLSEWSDEDLELYVDFEKKKAAEQAKQEILDSMTFKKLESELKAAEIERNAKIDMLQMKAQAARQKLENMKESALK